MPDNFLKIPSTSLPFKKAKLLFTPEAQGIKSFLKALQSRWEAHFLSISNIKIFFFQ